MMVGRMLENGDLTGLKFTLVNAMKDLRYYTHLAESLPTPAHRRRSGAPERSSRPTCWDSATSYIASLMEAQEKLAGVTIVRRA